MLLPTPPLVVVLLLLLIHGSVAEKDPREFDGKEIEGTYLFLNFSALGNTEINYSFCPRSFYLPAKDALRQEDGYTLVDVTDMRIVTDECEYSPESLGFVEFDRYPIPAPDGNSSSPKQYLWSATVEDDMFNFKCSSSNIQNILPSLRLTLLPVPDFFLEFHGPGHSSKKEEATKGYMLLSEEFESPHVCTYFKPKTHGEIRKLYEQAFSPQGHEFGDEKLPLDKPLQFCPICNCSDSLGSDISLSNVEVKNEESDEDSDPAENPKSHSTMDGRRPHSLSIFVHGHQCPVAFSKPLEAIMSDSGTSHTSESDEITDDDHDLEELVQHAVINKLYDELQRSLPGMEENPELEKQRENAFMIAGTFHRRKVYGVRGGKRCGAAQTKLQNDTIFLLEKQHLLWQIANNPFVRKNSARVRGIRERETDTDDAFTIHVIRKKTEDEFSVCVLSNSHESCDFLSVPEFCDNFVPLGSKVVEPPNDLAQHLNATYPEQDKTPPTETAEGPADGNSEDKDKNQALNNSTSSPVPGSSSAPQEGDGPSTTDTSSSPDASPTASATEGPSPNSANSSETAKCFPAEAKVQLDDGRMIRMDELKIGTSVLDGSGLASKVILFTHAIADIYSQFVRLETSGADIVLSAQHYIPVNGQLVTAETVKQGNNITVIADQERIERVVSRVGKIRMRGLYNPQTVSGTIAVAMSGDLVLASTYTQAIPRTTAHSLLAPLRFLENTTGLVVPILSKLFRDGCETAVRLLPYGLIALKLI